ncbi:hypothetical protein CL6EHI_130470 [Entamoeba histolytica]|uniref:Uncharacterized protein n=2 Tax=Entamoeba histolytica TaxID=5759 RepID=C4MAQ7_ENTH1|nr:hypothetical protein EHI_130470 [Entamoeba histolytica HM-1:IMSS]EAL43037.1 hypothetical protein EHI_130470 [Entamoeba histolytica HM-1:IMSS]GAT98911.1 hypothetical protein CL6EHI_130470 [Entamoeba histolytica]|eukprot:XP_648424.1 hypothetical protein EHI_130470 [Entamoeba histolytica HM-1:IMSS]
MVGSLNKTMYGTPDTRNIIQDEEYVNTILEERDLHLIDVLNLLKDLKKINNECNILTNGFELKLGYFPFESLSTLVYGHLKAIDNIDSLIKDFNKKNSLLITKLKEMKRRDEREERIDKLEKKREEETKPERRKTRPL